MFKLIHVVRFFIGSCIALVVATSAFAGSNEEELKHEISFLAKKLLDMSGEDSATVEQKAFMKPFIGICSDVTPGGIKLTCITPGHNASKAGLKTGDLILSINGIDMIGIDKNRVHKKANKNPFYSLTKTMKIGDQLVMKLLRNGQKQEITAIVGAVSQPAFTLTVRKK